MRILTKHLGLTIILMTLMVSLVLLGLQTFIEVDLQLEKMSSNGYGLLTAFFIVLLRMPENFYHLFPMAGLLGSLMGLGRLAQNNELVVMRCAGLSVKQLMLPILKATALMLIVMVFLGEVVAPYTSGLARELQQTPHESMVEEIHAVNTNKHGIWLRLDNDFFHVASADSAGHLQGVTQFHFDAQQHLVSASFAKHATVVGKIWQLKDISQSQFNKDYVEKSVVASKEMTVTVNPYYLIGSTSSVRTLSLPELYQFIRYRKQSGLAVREQSFLFYKRLIQPLTILVMVLLSVPILLGPLGRKSPSMRLVVGILIGFAFYTVNDFLGPFSLVFQIPTWLAASFPAIVFAMLGWGLIWYPSRRRKG